MDGHDIPPTTSAREDLAPVRNAIERLEKVLQRRPDMGRHDDTPATVRWLVGTRMVAHHDNGSTITTDVAPELGGAGADFSPGWLFRAGLASCASTCIVVAAATAGIDLRRLEVEARSRSDACGLFGMTDDDGAPIPAAPTDVQLHVRIAAPGVEATRLRTLVADAMRCSPIPAAVRTATPVGLAIEVEGA